MRFKRRSRELLRNVITNYLSPCGETLLHFAARDNNPKEIEYYIHYNIPINYKSFAGETALYYCAYNDSIDAASTLVNMGANIHSANVLGFTVATECVYCKSYKTLKFISKDYIPTQVDSYGLTPLHHAMLLNDARAVRILTMAITSRGFWYKQFDDPDYTNPNFIKIMDFNMYVKWQNKINANSLQEAFR